MIQKICVKGLFGLYDYNILFSEKPAVKILTGPNGYGKTTILQAIDHLYKGDFWFFHFLSFEKFEVVLSEQTVVILKSPAVIVVDSGVDKADETDEELFVEKVSLLDKSGDEIESVIITEEYIQKLINAYRGRLLRESMSVKDEELLSMFYNAKEDDYIQLQCKNISLALQEYETIFLPAQRVYNHHSSSSLFRYSRNSLLYEIDRVNEDISRLYRMTQNMFAATSQRIDATFISRLIKRDTCYTKKELKTKLAELKSRIDGYKEVNLFSDMELLDYSMEDDQSYTDLKKVLSLYVDDMNAKMDRFEELYQKISLYKRVVSNKVLSEKTIDFNDNGLLVMNTKGYVLKDLHKLSSGEQNLLILYFNLIFKSNGKTILLIDEPENSLHVAWQSRMLDDYIAMSETTGCQVLLATHSPTFIDGRWELTTDLYRQYKGKD